MTKAPRFIDVTPTWAAIMPGFAAILESGTPEGKAMAREELARLARLVDSANAAAKEEPGPGLDKLHAGGRLFAAIDLGRAASDFAATGAHMRAACYYEAAARIAPAGAQEARDFRAAADLQEREASRLLTQSRDAIAKEARNDSAADLAKAARDALAGAEYQRAAALFAAAHIVAPHSIFADSWQSESTAAGLQAYKARAAAIAAAKAEGMEEGGKARAAALAEAGRIVTSRNPVPKERAAAVALLKAAKEEGGKA